MTHFSDKVAVITGAGSGIGRALAVELARQGAAVAISDVDTLGLAETEKQVAALGAQVRADHLDVAQRELIVQYAEDVAGHFGRVNLLFNNAGIAYTGSVQEMPFKDLDRVMDVDFWGVANGTKAFLPHLIESGEGHVVNISSLFGILSVPSQSAYNAAKFAVRGFTEALRQEMILGGHPVKVTCVHPGGIRTNIARNGEQARSRDHDDLVRTFDKVARTSPERAARIILGAVEKDRARVLVGADAKVLDVMVRITGSHYQRLATAFSRRNGL